jgi:chemotaxis protein MotB
VKRRRQRYQPPSHERWLVSYADFITLLFAFFTVMYASSTVDAQKFGSMVMAMQTVFSGGTGDVPGAVLVPPATPSIEQRNSSLVLVAAQMQRDLAGHVAAGRVSIDMDQRGVIVSIQESGSFVTGRAELPPAAQALIRQIAAGLVALPNAIRVEGHTDDVPIQTARYESNWDLSTARATRVVEQLMLAGVAASRLSAAGYSEFHPRVANDSPENRARNRRVDLVILNAATEAAEEPRR